MADITVKESCGCGATFYATGSNYRSIAGGGTNGQHRSAEEMAERWRVEHRHMDPQPAPVVFPPRAVARIPHGGARVRRTAHKPTE